MPFHGQFGVLICYHHCFCFWKLCLFPTKLLTQCATHSQHTHTPFTTKIMKQFRRIQDEWENTTIDAIYLKILVFPINNVFTNKQLQRESITAKMATLNLLVTELKNKQQQNTMTRRRRIQKEKYTQLLWPYNGACHKVGPLKPIRQRKPVNRSTKKSNQKGNVQRRSAQLQICGSNTTNWFEQNGQIKLEWSKGFNE